MLAFSKWKSIRILGSKTTAHMQQSTAAGRMSVSSCEETAQLLVMIVWLLLNQRLNSNRRNIQKELHPRRCSSLCMIASRDWVGVTLLISCARSWSKSCQWLYVKTWVWFSCFLLFTSSWWLQTAHTQQSATIQWRHTWSSTSHCALRAECWLAAQCIHCYSTGTDLIWSQLWPNPCGGVWNEFGNH